MNFLLFVTLFSWLIYLNTAEACQINVPTSEAQRYIEAMPNGVPPLYSCADKPEEVCHCADTIIWEYAELATEFVQDDIGINQEKKVLRSSPVKKLAHELKVKAERDAEVEKLNKKQAAKAKVKSFEFKGKTIAELRSEMNEFLIELKEVQE